MQGLVVMQLCPRIIIEDYVCNAYLFLIILLFTITFNKTLILKGIIYFGQLYPNRFFPSLFIKNDVKCLPLDLPNIPKTSIP